MLLLQVMSDQYQYLGNYAPTPLLPNSNTNLLNYYNMLGQGRGGCAVAQILILIGNVSVVNYVC